MRVRGVCCVLPLRTKYILQGRAGACPRRGRTQFAPTHAMYLRVVAGFHARPWILMCFAPPSRLRRATSPINGEVCGTVRPFPTCTPYISCVGGVDSAPRCRGGSPRPPVDFDGILRNASSVVPYGCRGSHNLIRFYGTVQPFRVFPHKSRFVILSEAKDLQ